MDDTDRPKPAGIACNPIEYRAKVSPADLTPTAIALASLFPVCRRRDVLALFHNRVSYSAIRHWKAGRAMPPQWAVDALELALERRAAELLAPAAKLKAGPGAGSYGRTGKPLQAWHAARATARDKANQS